MPSPRRKVRKGRGERGAWGEPFARVRGEGGCLRFFLKLRGVPLGRKGTIPSSGIVHSPREGAAGFYFCPRASSPLQNGIPACASMVTVSEAGQELCPRTVRKFGLQSVCYLEAGEPRTREVRTLRGSGSVCTAPAPLGCPGLPLLGCVANASQGTLKVHTLFVTPCVIFIVGKKCINKCM